MRPPPRLRFSAWIEQHLLLPDGVSALPGPVRLWPYQRAIAGAIGDPAIECVTVVNPVRAGVTTLLTSAIASYVANDPAPIFSLLPVEADLPGLRRVGAGADFAASPAVLRELGREADLRIGDAQALDFPDASFDTVVCTLSLCSIPDDARAVAEARRVLRPGGRLLLLEHVRSPAAAVQVVQRLLEPLFSRDGDTLLREPLDHLVAEGFEIERLERAKWSIVERVVGRKSPGSCAPAAR